MLVARIRQLSGVRAELLQLHETRQQRERAIGDRFATDREIFDRGETAERAEIRLGEGITFHLHLRDDARTLRDLRSQFFEGFNISSAKAAT